MTDWKPLQHNLGVAADGIPGRNTFRALFQRLGADTGRAVELALSANVHFPAYGIMDSKLRLCHFMAQLSHESGGFRYMEEIASGAAYEGRKDLGNTQPGDGKRYKGRGPIQLTGRANYREYGQALGIAFEEHPEIVAIPSIGLHVALEYWKRKGLSALADNDDLEGITRKVNGGVNGLSDRKQYLGKMKGLVG
ncbi:glycoside hydrolase family 19 protein [Sphingobium sp. HDIP04]|uniref:glycoside hydrolase family 19 protein n=1 Tax=Sphingobium sp. HDIP04 TaxID=428994 RepID=UPI000387645D|nr:glycoside hydrolase family 19 protein [Sphingobium sp. HDIP04]EQB03848.1 pyocin R, lytic enzyme [Sphingobium sp. HDIP04]